MREEIYDAVIVGGGPAGACAAIELARAGGRVLLAEQGSFPRPKLCGEFISPECLEYFARLGVMELMTAAGAREVSETVFYARSGRSVAVPSEWLAAACAGGVRRGVVALGLSRAEMDERLLERAREVGVEVSERTRAVGLLSEAWRVRGVRLKTEGREVREARARLTIDATGRARTLARMVERGAGEMVGRGAGEPDAGAHGRRRRAPLVAFKAHLEGVRGAAGKCEIYFYRGGYGGLSPVEGGQSNLCFIASARDVRACGSDAGRVLREIVMSNARAAASLEGARVRSEWLSVAIESFGRGTLVPARGLLAVGDAASFIDPFTGSGMLMALESGTLAAHVAARWLARLRDADDERLRDDAPAREARDVRRRATETKGSDERTLDATHAGTPLDALHDELASDYAACYEKRFASRLRVCSLLRRAAFAPAPLIEAGVAALGASASVRRALARATRGHARVCFDEAKDVRLRS